MKENWSNKQTEFWNLGYTIFDGLFPDELLKKWRETAIYLSKNSNDTGVNHIEKEYKEANKEISDAAGIYKFCSLDGRILYKENLFPGLKEYYHSNSNFLSLLLGIDVITSDDLQSSISTMIYEPPGGQLLYHYDKNFPSFVLYLTDNKNEGGTRLFPLTSLKPTILGEPDEIVGGTEIVYPKFGRVLCFNGARCFHASESVEKNIKISVVFNYFERDKNNRPSLVSKRLYN